MKRMLCVLIGIMILLTVSVCGAKVNYVSFDISRGENTSGQTYFAGVEYVDNIHICQ